MDDKLRPGILKSNRTFLESKLEMIYAVNRGRVVSNQAGSGISARN